MAKFLNDQGDPLTYEELENRLVEEMARFDSISMDKMTESSEFLKHMMNIERDRDDFSVRNLAKREFLRDLISGSYATLAQAKTAIQNFLNNHED